MAPDSLADIEDEVVRTVQSSIMSDRGVDVKRDLQVSKGMRAAATDVFANSDKQEIYVSLPADHQALGD